MRKAVVAVRIAVPARKHAEPDVGVADDGVTVQHETLRNLEPRLSIDDVYPSGARQRHDGENEDKNAGERDEVSGPPWRASDRHVAPRMLAGTIGGNGRRHGPTNAHPRFPVHPRTRGSGAPPATTRPTRRAPRRNRQSRSATRESRSPPAPRRQTPTSPPPQRAIGATR